jgi:hypothetical protein
MIAYGWKVIGLPLGLQLLEFEVKRNEDSDSPGGFKSNARCGHRRWRNGDRRVLDESSV